MIEGMQINFTLSKNTRTILLFAIDENKVRRDLLAITLPKKIGNEDYLVSSNGLRFLTLRTQ